MPRRFLTPWFWLCLYVAWFATLWWFSSRPVVVPQAMHLMHVDKLYHFGYFFGGSGLFSAFLYRAFHGRLEWSQLLWFTMLAMTAIGAIDEWHQSLHPARSGNDAIDLCADVFGSLAGYRVFRWLHHWLDEPSDAQSS